MRYLLLIYQDEVAHSQWSEEQLGAEFAAYSALDDEFKKLGVEMKGGEAAAKRMAARTNIFALAESLGGVESLIEVPLAMTHGSVKGTKLAPPAGLVRLSVGIETVSDLIADLAQAIG